MPTRTQAAVNLLPDPSSTPLQYDGDWEYRWGDSPRNSSGNLTWALSEAPSAGWSRTRHKERLSGRNGNSWLWLRIPVPETRHRDPVLFLNGVMQQIQIFVDGRQVYEWGDFLGTTARFRGVPAHLVRLPLDAAGKTLSMRVFSAQSYIGPFGSVLLGEHGAVVSEVFRADLSRLIVGGLLFLLGLMGFGLFCLRREDSIFLSYGVLSLSGSAYVCSHSMVVNLLVPHPLLVGHISIWSLQLTMLSLCYLVVELFGPGPWQLLPRLKHILWLFLFGSAATVTLGITSLMGVVPPVQAAVFVVVVVAGVLPIGLHFRNSVDARVFGIGFSIASVVAIRDVLVAMGMLSHTQQELGHFAHLGYGVFFLSLAVILIRRMIIALSDRDRAIAMFGQHVSPKVAERLLREQDGGASELRHVCVLFLDIRDFTRFSESRSPSEVVMFLNTLFDPLVAVVDRHGGTINKFLGDGFLAIFGAPLSDGKHCEAAVHAALALVQEVDSLVNTKMIPPTRIGIGLHAGEVVVGSVGSHLRREYTVIGDAVNLTSRIEQLTKSLGAQVLASDAVVAQLADTESRYDKLASVQVKGREAPVQVYKLA